MNEEESLRLRYLRQLSWGVALLVLLAIPAVVFSHSAIESLFNRPADWLPDSLPEKVEFNELVENFSVSDLVMFGWEESTLDSPSLVESANLLRPLCKSEYDAATDAKLIAELPQSAREQIEQIRSDCRTPTPLEWVRTGAETLSRLTKAPINLPEKAAIARLQGSLIGPDERQTCLLVSFGIDGAKNRRTLVPALRRMIGELVDREPTEVAVVGNQFDGAMVDTESIQSMRFFTPPSAIIAAILCLLCLRSIPLTATIVAVAVIGEGLVLAMVYATGTPMNAVLIVLPPLVFVLTVSAGIHLSNYFLDAAREFPQISTTEAARRAMRAGVAPCCLAAATTVVGLSSLMIVRLHPVRVFGGVAAVGVLVTLLLLLLVLPGAMVLTRRKETRHDNGDSSPAVFLAWASRWMRRRLVRPWPLILGFLVISIGFSFGLTRLESTVNVPRMFLPDSDIRRQYDWFERLVGPTVTGEVLLAFPPLGEDEDPLLRLAVVAKVHRHLLKQGPVRGAISAMTFVPSIPSKRTLSATAQRSVVRKLIRDPGSSLGRLGFIARDGKQKKELWRISVRMPQHQRADFADDLAAIRSAVQEQLVDPPLPVMSSLTGSVVIVQRSQEILLQDLFRSFITAFAVIAVVMSLMLRSVIGGLLAMAPNLFPTVTLFGMMGLCRIPLDIGSVMSASVALGIAVDDTVHLLSRYGSRRARGFGQIRAAFGALRQCGWAMLQTTLVCGVALMAYWFSDFVPTSRFSLFMFALLSSALLGVILLLPTMMASVLGKWLSHAYGVDKSIAIHADHPDLPPPHHDHRRLPTHREATLSTLNSRK